MVDILALSNYGKKTPRTWQAVVYVEKPVPSEFAV
jgi:hypothetical protein